MSHTQLEALVRLLTDGEVEFVVVGRLAAVVHGSAHVTYDVDVCYNRSPDNLERLSHTLAQIRPVLRGAPPVLPFRLDLPTLKAGLNFTPATELGALDLLGEVSGLGGFREALAASDAVELFDRTVRVLSLPALIAAKKAAGRGKDLLIVPELEALLALRPQPERPDEG
jgi:hypothetical protein